MISLGKIFKKYTGLLRRLKLSYVINNLLNGHSLKHNKELYEQYGVKRSIFSPIGSHNFGTHHADIPWLDAPDAMDRLTAHPDFAGFPDNIQKELIRFIEEGYMVLKGFQTDDQVDRLNADIDRLMTKGDLDVNYTGRKIMESFRVSEIADQEFFRNPKLLELLNFIMGKPIVPFHTINFIKGSEQRAHSDFIHMTTEPQGYLIAAWTALEDVDKNNGTIFYYPKSHRLPYVTAKDYDSGNSRYLIGTNSNANFEDYIEELIDEHGLEKKDFVGKKGDVFIWHANLIHGGNPILKEGVTRKSMVAHYFCEGVICYHEISQRPALMDI